MFFVITADQINSQHRPDRVDAALRWIMEGFADRLVAEAERTAGDEFQTVTADGDAALEICLGLVRFGDWSVGLGIGEKRDSAAASVRAMTGSAFLNAREAVERAKKRPSRFAAVVDTDLPRLSGVDVLVRLLLALRERRTPEGWELLDVIDSQAAPSLTDAAAHLGISAQAASQRSWTANLRLDREARDMLVQTFADGGHGELSPTADA